MRFRPKEYRLRPSHRSIYFVTIECAGSVNQGACAENSTRLQKEGHRMRQRLENRVFSILLIIGFSLFATNRVAAESPLLVYQGKTGPGFGKQIVLVAGDEEYRSEEALPQLAKILALAHGFRCTVLFPIDPKSGIIDPNNGQNIPGLETLRDAELMIIATRYRDLPDAQMKEIDDYLRRGGPVVGLRTATHGFNIPKGKKYAHYGNGYAGERRAWQGGFGRLVLGEKWISHHGNHRSESTRGLIAPAAEDHPIRRGIEDGEIWGPTDVYGVRLPLPGDSRPIVLGQVLSGMHTDDPPVSGQKNDPLMPIAWTKTYQLPGGSPGRAFTTTMGSSTDLLSEGTRRMLANGVYWALGMEEALDERGASVDLIEPFEPSDYGFKPDQYWSDKALKPTDFKLK